MRTAAHVTLASLLLAAAALVLALVPLAFAGDTPTTTPEEATRTEVGQTAPDFTLELVSGEEFHLGAHRGEVVLVNFFATWCPPCIEEMPHLQEEVVARFADAPFAFVAVGREHENAELPPFARKHDLDLPMAGDADRSVYALYAEHTIPRNVVVGPDGTILFQSIGFEREDFDRMITVIESALGELEAAAESGAR